MTDRIPTPAEVWPLAPKAQQIKQLASAACPRCPDGHRDPATRSWGTRLGPPAPETGTPEYVIVQPSGGGHVAEVDALWLWQLTRHAHQVPGWPGGEAQPLPPPTPPAGRATKAAMTAWCDQASREDVQQVVIPSDVQLPELDAVIERPCTFDGRHKHDYSVIWLEAIPVWIG